MPKSEGVAAAPCTNSLLWGCFIIVLLNEAADSISRPPIWIAEVQVKSKTFSTLKTESPYDGMNFGFFVFCIISKQVATFKNPKGSSQCVRPDYLLLNLLILHTNARGGIIIPTLYRRKLRVWNADLPKATLERKQEAGIQTHIRLGCPSFCFQ